MSRKLLTLLSLLVVFALLLGACGRGGNEEPTAVPEAPAAEAPAEAATEAPAPVVEEPAASTEMTATEAVTEAAAVTETAAMTEAAAMTETAPVTETEAVTDTGATTETAAAAETSASPMIPGGALEQAMAGDFKGTVVIMDGPFADADARKFEDSVVAFEEATGIDIQYIGGKGFEASINTRVDAGDAPGEQDGAPLGDREAVSEPLMGQLVGDEAFVGPARLGVVAAEARERLRLQGDLQLVAGDDGRVRRERIRTEQPHKLGDHLPLAAKRGTGPHLESGGGDDRDRHRGRDWPHGIRADLHGGKVGRGGVALLVGPRRPARLGPPIA